MDITQEEIGKFGVLPDISFASSAGAKVQKPPFMGGHMQFDPSFTSSRPMGNRKVKFMCSSAGKILPRPSDMKLRYAGGETRMVSVPRYVEYAAFHSKMVELYGPDIALRYQLPEEDLDALVSVSSDEDLENMMEECDRLTAGEGSSKLRVFVFPASELDVHDLGDLTEFKSSERKFVDAINALSADFLPGMPKGDTPGKSYANSDSFNEAYKAWNGIQSLENGSSILKNPYSDVASLENYESSGNQHRFESFMPNHIPGSISPFSHSNFMGQPALPDMFPSTDAFGNGIDHPGLDESSSLFQDDVCHQYAENPWEETDLPKNLTLDDRGEDKTYKTEHPFQDQSGAKSRRLPILKGVTFDDRGIDQTYRAEESYATEHGMRQFGVETPFNSVEPADDSPTLDGQVPIDLHNLSPGGFLQRQLMSSSPSLLSQIRVELGRPTSELLGVDDSLQHSVSSGVKDQQQSLYELAALQDHWAKLPVYDSSLGLDEESQALRHMDGQSSGMQSPSAAELPLLLNESSASVFPATSAPSSPPVQKLQANIKYGVEQPHVDSCEACKTGILPPDITVPFESSDQASTDVSSLANILEKKLHMNMESISGQFPAQDFSRNYPASCIGSETKPYPSSSATGVAHEGAVNSTPSITRPTNVFSDVHPTMASSYEAMGQPFEFQNGEEGIGFRASVKDGHHPSFSLSEGRFTTGETDIDCKHQHGNERIGKFSHLSEAVSSDIRAPSSTAESSRSRSVDSQEDNPLWRESGNSTARADGEALFAPVEGVNFPVSTHGNSHHLSFHTMPDSMVSKEPFEMSIPFPDALNNGTSLFAEESYTTNREDTSIPVSYPAQVPALISLMESWEDTLLKNEDGQYNAVQHQQMHEQTREEFNPNPIFDREIELEQDPLVELDEVDKFESFHYRPTNAAAIAEQEAIARGLQTIRNCDLEELQELGSGTFGTVYHGKWRGTDVAIKRIKASCFTGRQAERDRLVADFWREAYILGQLHHPNVVAFYGVVPDGPGGTLATVTEYMVNGSLKQVLQNKDRSLDRRKRLLIAMDAAFGMEYLHGKNVVHFDIKCENLLVNLRDAQRPICKVGDLGLSKVKQQTFVSGGVRGTLPWMAPELLNGSSSLVSEKVDVFSFGIVMWELLTGEEPYANMHYGAIIGGIVNNTLRPTVPRWCDAAWKALMEKCWAADPGDRPTFLEIARSLRAMEVSIAAKGQGQARILDMYQ